MTKSEMIQYVSESYSEGMVLSTLEFLLVDGENNSRIEGTYDFNSAQEFLDFFSSNYDEGMTRQGHNTRIVSCEFEPR
jgi:hypothetical protein